MARKRNSNVAKVASPASVLLVGPPSASLDRKRSLLQNSGYDTAIADNICHAEVFAESHYFDAAIYDDSLPEQEQVSLARVMRIRWPWMRLISCGLAQSGGVFDASQSSESQLPETLREILT